MTCWSFVSLHLNLKIGHNYKRAISYFEQFERLQGLPLIQFTVNGEKEEILERETLKKLPITFRHPIKAEKSLLGSY